MNKFKYYAYGFFIQLSHLDFDSALIDMTWFSVFHSVLIHFAPLTVINLSNCNFSLIAMNFVTLLIMIIIFFQKKKNVSTFFHVFLLPQRKVISFNFQFYSSTQGHSSKKMKKKKSNSKPHRIFRDPSSEKFKNQLKTT